MGVGRLGLTLTQHLLLQLSLAWRGPRLGPAPASQTLTHLSVICQSAGPAAQAFLRLNLSPTAR